MNHKVLLLNAGFSLYGLIQQNPTLKQQFALLGLNFGNEVMVNDRQQLIGQISQSVKNCRLLLLVDNAPELRAREILAQGFNKPLHQDEKALQDIREYLSQNGRMANARLQNAMIPQDAVPLSAPGCGQAGFALFFPQTCVALVSGSAKDVLRLVANQLFPLLLLVGIVYICETLSDIIQVAYFKATHGKRIFKMAPLHHHFELCGWSEVKLVTIFTLVSAVFCMLALWGVIGRYHF